MSNQETIWIVTEEVSETSNAPMEQACDVSEASTVVKKRVPVEVASLKTQMTSLLKVVGYLFDLAELQTGIPLNEVELSVEINAEGQVNLIGTSTQAGKKGGITLKFKHPNS